MTTEEAHFIDNKSLYCGEYQYVDYRCENMMFFFPSFRQTLTANEDLDRCSMCQRVQRTRHSITFSCVPVLCTAVELCQLVWRLRGDYLKCLSASKSSKWNVKYGELMQRKQARIGICEVRQFTTTHGELVLEIWSVVGN